MSERKSISVSAGTHQQLERLGEKLGLSHKDLIAAMVQYFSVTKADPRDPKADAPSVALKKMADKVDGLDKRLIGFIREQEKELLKPILSEVRATRTQISQSTGVGAKSAGLTAEQLEEQLTGVVEAFQTLIRLSFRTALVDNALRPEYRQQTDELIKQQGNRR
ncbi:BfmA/BtgA family mobilization protein [Spirosoma soli]|uniref:BfmA/BtgA family mobilization protein n=1 Tax=Spirosoma soli TaxID=1770529 RepID=A0ABW5MC46_9BACT